MNKFHFFTAQWVLGCALAAALLLPGALRLEAATTTVSVSKDDGVPAATHVHAGSTITYTNTITNTGAAGAANLQFVDPDVAHAAYKAGTLSATPVAVDDTYGPTVIANSTVDTSVSSGFNVLSNDFYGYAGGAALAAANAAVTVTVTASPAHGSVTFNSGANKGTFIYTPTAGYTGPDSFKYTLSNGVTGAPVGSDQGTVNLTVGGPVIWYVDAVNGSNSNSGTLGHPFQTLAKVSTVDAVNQKIFLLGTNTATYSGGIVLKAGESLVGQAAQGGSFDTVMGLGSPTLDTFARPTLTPGLTRPRVTNGSGNAITLAEGNVVVGLDVTSAAGSGISGSNVNAGVIGNASLSDVSISGTTGNGIALNGGSGSFAVNAAITTTSGNSVNIANRSGGTVTFAQAIGDTGAGINLTSNANTTITFTGVITASTAGNTAFNATNNGTVTVTAATSTLTTTTGIALNVVSTTIGAGGLTFKTINAGTAASGPSSGIVLNNTGASGSLTVTGNGNTSRGGDNSGGTIQKTAGPGIALASTLSPSFTNMNILNTTRSGIAGTSVSNFTLANSNIDTSGSQNADANIAFNSTSFLGAQTLDGTNISGTLSITSNTLKNGFAAGLDVQADNGTVTNATVTNNTVTNPTSGGSGGTAGISFVGTGNGSTVFNLNNASISSNTITGQKAGGIQVSIGNSSAGGGAVAHAGFVTFDGSGRPVSDPSHIISITGNSITSIDTNATQAIVVANSTANASFRTQTNFEIKNNGTVGTPLGSSGIGTVMLIGNNGNSDMAGVVDSNFITATQTANGGGGNGIAGGNGVTHGNTDTPKLNLVVTNNTVSGTDGNGMLLVGRGVSGQFYLKVANNTVGAPVNAGGTSREGIRVDAGNNSSADDAVFLNIFGNTSAGSNTASGIGLRKNGTVAATNDFALYDAAGGPSLPATPVNSDITTFVNALNPGSATGGGFGTGGTDIINGSNFLKDTTLAPPLIFAAGGIERAQADATSGTPRPAAVTGMQTEPGPATGKATAENPAAAAAAAGSSARIQQSDLDGVVAAAIARWQASGLTGEQLASLRGMKFEVASLGDNHLGEADGGTIRVDANAGGKGWFTDASDASDALFNAASAPTRRYTVPTAAPAGRVDLLTTIIHEMGHVLGLNDTYSLMERNNIMYGHLTQGERRLPARDQARGATPFSGGVTHFLTNVIPDPVVNPTGIDTLINPVNIATLPAGKGVVIKYDVQIESPIVGGTQLDSQATVSSTSGSIAATTSVDFAAGVATGQAHTFTILAVPPTVSATTTTVAQNSSGVIITGSFFDTTAGNNTVTFSNGAAGTVTAATSTQLTVSFTTAPASVGSMTAVVTTPDGTSGAGVQVATVVPAPLITSSTASLGITAATVTINGGNFSATPGQNTVVFNDGAVGTVTAATATQLTVTLSTQPTAVGSLTANVTSFGGASGAIQVAAVVPVVNASATTIAANSPSFAIGGTGFSATPASNSVTFSGAGTGSVTPSAATTTSLTVAPPAGLVAGPLNAVVTTSTFASTPAVQVATIAPVVTVANPPLAANATTVTFAGFGFSSTPANNTVTFNNGAVGTVTSASNTSLTVTFSTAPVTAGALFARVTTNGVISSGSTQVASVTPVVTLNTATIQNTATTLVINGFGFSPTPASNSVTFSGFATGAVTAATPTQLTVTFGTAPSVGDLNVIVSAGGQASGSFVKVATVISLSITSSTTNLVQSAATLDIAGTGFSTTPANNTVTFNNGAVGTVTSATSTLLTVTFSTKATSLGALNATVTVVGTGTSGPTQVATVVAGAAAKLAVITQPTSTTSGATISPSVTVQIQDANGFLTTSTANVTMAIGTNPGSGTLSGTATIAAVAGTATFSTLNIDKAGTGYTLGATSGVLTAATSSAFNITAGAAAKLAVITQPTNTVSATAISPAVTVQIQDAAGNLTASTANVVIAIGTNPSSGTLSG
ncbi:MAG: hypothetical protein JWP85_2716, partial [Rhodoglobus sp.]|nr:hypothetical protein [Rhodoglobus sp.]